MNRRKLYSIENKTEHEMKHMKKWEPIYYQKSLGIKPFIDNVYDKHMRRLSKEIKANLSRNESLEKPIRQVSQPKPLTSHKNTVKNIRKLQQSLKALNTKVTKRNQDEKSHLKLLRSKGHKKTYESRYNKYTLTSMSREEVTNLIHVQRSAEKRRNNSEINNYYVNQNQKTAIAESFTVRKRSADQDNSRKNSLLKKALKYFDRNENIITDKIKIINENSLSTDMIHQGAEVHEGSKIFKLKARNISNRKPIFYKKKENVITKSDAKYTFVHFVTKNMFSGSNSNFKSSNSHDGSSFDPIVAHFTKEVHDEIPDDNLEQIGFRGDPIKPIIDSTDHAAAHDAVFWCHKGYTMQIEQNFNTAIDYYIQGIKIDPNNITICYNMGCIYSDLNMIKSCLHWFAKAYMIDYKNVQGLYALSIASFRGHKNKVSLDLAMKGLHQFKNQLGNLKFNIFYIIAINYKVLGNLTEANNFYKQLVDIIRKSERTQLIKYTWGLMMIPLIKNRKETIKMVENLNSLINFYAIKDPVDEIGHSYDYKHNKWYNKDFPYEYLKDGKFFLKFTEAELKEIIIPNLTGVRYEKHEVIHSKKDNVQVVILGEAVLLSHKRQFTPSKLQGRYQEGDIIGLKTDDTEPISIHDWGITRTVTVTAVFSNQDFIKIWRIYGSKFGNFNIQIVKSGTLLKNLSKVSIMKIYDLIEKRKYAEGSLIGPQSKKSPINFDYTEFYNEDNMVISGFLQNESDLSDTDPMNSPFKKAVRWISFMQPKVAKQTIKTIKLIPKALVPGIQKRLPNLLSKKQSLVNQIETKKSEFFDSSKTTFDTQTDGIYIIMKGKGCVVNRKDNYHVCDIFKGDSFGEGDVLKISDFTYYGDIYAKSDVELLFIRYKDFELIPLAEIERMFSTQRGSAEVEQRQKSIIYTVANRYKVDINSFYS